MRKNSPKTYSLLKVFLLGSVLIWLNDYWILQMEFGRWSFPTYLVPYYNVIFIVLVLIIVSLVIKLIIPRLALNHSELLLIYLMLSIATSICSHNMMEILVTTMGHPFHYATPENDWKDLFWRYLPQWLLVDDEKVLQGYYEGASTLYTKEHLFAWAKPMGFWTLFTAGLIFVMLCINVIVRKQWTDSERLTYPTVQLPFSIIQDSGGLFRNKMMWIGFAITGIITLVNGIHYLVPVVPEFPVKRLIDLRRYFTERPWNAIGWTPITLHPHVVGLGFFMPLDLLFSLWFFYLFVRMQRIVTAAAGWRLHYFNEQSIGAAFAIVLGILWVSRSYIKNIFRNLFGRKSFEDSSAPMSYRSATLGVVGGLTFLVLFSSKAGMTFGIALAFFILYYIWSFIVTRIRAELGFPVHDFHYPRGPDHILITTLGTRRLGPSNLSILAIYHWFNRTYASHPMPNHLESMKCAERLEMANKKYTRTLFWVSMFATIFGTIATFWIILHGFFKFGSASGHYTHWGSGGFGRETFRILSNWIYYPDTTDTRGVAFIGGGFVFTSFLMLMQMRFLWWPFHPLGYIVSNIWGIHLWSSFFLSWLIKAIILKYGGVGSYRKAIPFFLGIILGEFIVGSIWNCISIVTGQPMYQFSIG